MEIYFYLDKVLSKNLLPYNVTPPRPAGPTEAERKIEELTRQLEEEMERNEEQGEYFGKLLKYAPQTLITFITYRNMSYVWRKSNWSWPSMSGHGEFVSHKLFYLLLLRASFAWKGIL